jgi:hypothetical protein
VTLPPDVTGEFSWHGVQRDLVPGLNALTVDAPAR